MDRKKLEALVWKHTHRDFRGKLADGTKTILHLGPSHGTELWALSQFTDDQLLAKLPRRVLEDLPGVADIDPYYAQGARCGHLEGKDRAGAYVIGEEEPLAWEAEEAHAYYGSDNARKFGDGYRVGYRLSAGGEPLPFELRFAPLPPAR